MSASIKHQWVKDNQHIFGILSIKVNNKIQIAICLLRGDSSRSSSQRLLATLTVRLKTYGDCAFAVAAPKLWNITPLDLRLSNSVDIKMAFNL